MGYLSWHFIITAINMKLINQYYGAVYEKQQVGLVLNVCPMARFTLSQHMKYFVKRPQSKKKYQLIKMIRYVFISSL